MCVYVDIDIYNMCISIYIYTHTHICTLNYFLTPSENKENCGLSFMIYAAYYNFDGFNIFQKVPMSAPLGS